VDKKILSDTAESQVRNLVYSAISYDKEVQRRAAVQLLLLSIEEDRHREGLIDTPARVAKMYDEIFAGYEQDPKEILGTEFNERYDEMVLVRDIPFYSHCEHHMVPFFGVAHVAYIPNGKVVGISKLARLVECFAKMLQIQERMTQQIAESIENVLQPLGVAVIIQAEHLCMGMRGIKKPGTKTVTSYMTGVFRHNENNARMELMQLINM
jgi:GTP cyclohydrolase I